MRSCDHRTLQEHEGAEGVLAGTKVTQSLDTQTNGERHVDLEGALRSKHVPELEAVIAGGGLGEHGEATVVPREGACVDDHTTDGGTVTGNTQGCSR